MKKDARIADVGASDWNDDTVVRVEKLEDGELLQMLLRSERIRMCGEQSTDPRPMYSWSELESEVLRRMGD